MILGAAPFFQPGWLFDNLTLVSEQTKEHIWLTAIAIGIGLAISLPLGVYAHRHRWAYGPIAAVTGVMYTIPSLALFAFLVSYTGLSTTTSEIGLVSYTLLILIRNIVAGLRGVPDDTKEAARGMGYSDRQLLFRVELPMALPVIMAGIRIATVTTIGLVTVTALIGKGGLGLIILQGLRGFNTNLSLWGAILSITLAVVADVLLLLLERRLTPWAKSRAVVAT